MSLFYFFFWLLTKNKFKCPRCNYPLITNKNDLYECINCGQLMFTKKMGNNIKHDEKTNFTAGENYRIDISNSFKFDTNFNSLNHLVIHNATNKLILAKLNDDDGEKYPISASGGNLVINPEDRIRFHSLILINTDGAAAATGSIYSTFGYLPIKED